MPGFPHQCPFLQEPTCINPPAGHFGQAPHALLAPFPSPGHFCQGSLAPTFPLAIEAWGHMTSHRLTSTPTTPGHFGPETHALSSLSPSTWPFQPGPTCPDHPAGYLGQGPLPSPFLPPPPPSLVMNSKALMPCHPPSSTCPFILELRAHLPSPSPPLQHGHLPPLRNRALVGMKLQKWIYFIAG